MTMPERAVWFELVGMPVVGLAYVAFILTRLAGTPVAEVHWVLPMILAMVSVIGVIVVGTVASAIATHVRAAARGEQADLEDGDVRDKQIELRGKARSHTVASLGSLATLILAMAGADPFWIANTLFLTGLLGATVGALVKLRCYLAGF